MASGDNILAADYNTIRTKTANILGSGSGQSGYGQSLQSTASESIGNTIGADEWQALRYDIQNIGLHQTNAAPSLTNPTTGSIITYGSTHPNTQYNTQIDSYIATKFTNHAARTIITGRGTASTTNSWSSLAYFTVTMSWASSAAARYFFNSGGNFKFSSSRSGGSASTQNTAWTNLLASAGTQVFSATSTLGAYDLTSTNQLFYSITDSGAYSTNVYRIYAKCNVSNNVSGGANIYTFYVEYDDNHTNPYYDTVNGTLSCNINETRATGPMVPSGTFTITAPTYNVGAFTTS